MDLGLLGKVAIVTGSSKGIGLATALQLANEGADVTICARNEENLIHAAKVIFLETGQKVHTVCADVSIKEDCERIINETIEHYGQLNILVNNAGTSSANSFESVENELWQDDLDLKLYGAVNCSKFAIPHMRAVGGGAIVNVTAIKGKAPSESSLPTSVSRAAGLALTKAMSKDLGKEQIRVNTVCIGLIRSSQIEQKWQTNAPGLSWNAFSEEMGKNIPLGRIGETEEAANVITFLVSDAASYVSGTAVNIDGGSAPVL
ncbi:SDR family NAD(P)-dependent oxidoreductase [Viridibacillus arvi]|uniref:SDR family NAD(P)-dependent oxidoreductase n=1 Tax=Viridibacillus arvi TaxID=263475 RepID=UPI00187B1EB2|nr:SDR family oxidoreductase [Viridibacillus sp. JNUCC-6]QOV10677.1 SDR family oxidoreductase [Viridibacillus sp. JNUCC-6]